MTPLNELHYFQHHPVATLTAVFAITYLLYKCVSERITFLLRSNAKYKFLDDWLAAGVHYGKDMGVDTILCLDGANPSVITRRIAGQKYLKSRLVSASTSSSTCSNESQFLSAALVDCRFPLPKVCMPLLRELEFNPSPRNFVSKVNASDGTIIKVIDPTGTERPYVGSDAVQTLGVKDFYEPIQNEINKRMALIPESKGSETMLRFAPTSLTPALERNVEMLLKLTDMDQVSRVPGLKISCYCSLLSSTEHHVH